MAAPAPQGGPRRAWATFIKSSSSHTTILARNGSLPGAAASTRGLSAFESESIERCQATRQTDPPDDMRNGPPHGRRPGWKQRRSSKLHDPNGSNGDRRCRHRMWSRHSARREAIDLNCLQISQLGCEIWKESKRQRAQYLHLGWRTGMLVSSSAERLGSFLQGRFRYANFTLKIYFQAKITK